jgi:hypothetical protein
VPVPRPPAWAQLPPVPAATASGVPVVQGSQAEMDALVALQVCVGGRGGGVEILDKGLEGSGRGEEAGGGTPS